MLVYSIIALTVLLFSAGSYFVIKGFRSGSKNDPQIVAISDIDELIEIKKNYLQGEQDTSSLKRDDVKITESLMDDSHEKEDLSIGKHSDPSIAIIEKYVEDIEIYKSTIIGLNMKIDDLSNKNKKLEDAIERELSSKDTTTLSNEEKEMLQESKKKAERAQESIDSLTKDSIAASSLIDKQKEKINELELSVEKYND